MLSNYALFFIENPSDELIDALWADYHEFSEVTNTIELHGINHIYLCPFHRSEANDKWFIYTHKRDGWIYSELIEVTKEEVDKFIAMYYLNGISFAEFMKLQR